MPLPGIWERDKVLPLLRRMMSDSSEVYKFAVVATGPKEGRLGLNKKEKLKRKEVRSAAEADAKASNGGKPVKLDVITGACYLDPKNEATLRLVVSGKAAARAVACAEHLLVRGEYKVAGFRGVLLEEAEEDDESATPTASSETTPSPQVTWENMLAQIEPRYSKAIADDPTRASKLQAVMAFAQGKAAATDYTAALVGLQRLADLLSGGSVGRGETPTVEPTNDLAAVWKARVAEWLPAIKAALVAKGPNLAEITRALTQAQALSKPGGDLTQALEALATSHKLATTDDANHPADNVAAAAPEVTAEREQSAATAGPRAATPNGFVRRRQFLLTRWQQIPFEIRADLQKLKAPLQEAAPTEDADELISLAEDYLDDVYGEMQDAIDDDINAGDPQYRAALKSIADFRQRIAMEPLIQHLKANSFKVSLAIESILLNALAEVEQNLAN